MFTVWMSRKWRKIKFLKTVCMIWLTVVKYIRERQRKKETEKKTFFVYYNNNINNSNKNGGKLEDTVWLGHKERREIDKEERIE